MGGRGDSGCMKPNSGCMKPNIAVFCSGNGSNFEALVKNNRKGKFPGSIELMVTDNADAFAVLRAQRLQIPVLFVDPKRYVSKEDYEKVLVRELRRFSIDLILLAGFMRILSPYFVKKFRNRILNIHPSLLPAFKGAHAIKDAFEYGVKVTGVTVHFVDEGVDSGPIILQGSVSVENNDTLSTLEAKIHKLEHRIYSQAVNIVLTKKWKISRRRFVLLS